MSEIATNEPSGPAVCAKCRHSARGTAIDMRGPLRILGQGREIPRAPRPGLSGGNYICGREGLTPAEPDPVTGFVGLPSGPDCRDLNPDGRCPHYKRGLTQGDIMLGLTVLSAVIALACLVAALGGVM